MLELLLGIVAFWSGFKVGQKMLLWPLRHLLDRVARQEGKSMEELIEEHYTLWAEEDDQRVVNSNNEEVITIEKHEDRYFAYGHTRGFLAQGSSFLMMFQALNDRMPNDSFVINKSEITELTAQEITDMGHAINTVWGSSTDETL